MKKYEKMQKQEKGRMDLEKWKKEQAVNMPNAVKR